MAGHLIDGKRCAIKTQSDMRVIACGWTVFRRDTGQNGADFCQATVAIDNRQMWRGGKTVEDAWQFQPERRTSRFGKGIHLPGQSLFAEKPPIQETTGKKRDVRLTPVARMQETLAMRPRQGNSPLPSWIIDHQAPETVMGNALAPFGKIPQLMGDGRFSG